MFYFWPTLLPLSLLVLILLAILLSVNFVLGLLVISLYGLIPKNLLFETLGGLLRNSLVEENIRATFQLHLTYRPPSSALFVWSPHGLFSVSSAMFNAFCIAKHEKYTPHKLASLSLLHYIPVLTDIANYYNNIPSDYQSIKKTLDTGQSVSVMLGGVREMMDIEPNVLKLYVKKRRGIFKLSIETGKPIIPVLTYGENDLLQPVRNDYVDTLNAYLHAWFGINVPFVRWASLYKWYQLSYKPLEGIHSYAGRPIYPHKDDTIDTLRERYICELKRIHKSAHKSVSLRIL
jgi:2-acylglycerol O-acyltransferase 2